MMYLKHSWLCVEICFQECIEYLDDLNRPIKLAQALNALKYYVRYDSSELSDDMRNK